MTRVVELITANIELSNMETTLVSAMSRMFIRKFYLSELKKDCDHILNAAYDNHGQGATVEASIAGREFFRRIPLKEIRNFLNHSFMVKMDESMVDVAESVKQCGVLVPALNLEKNRRAAMKY